METEHHAIEKPKDKSTFPEDKWKWKYNIGKNLWGAAKNGTGREFYNSPGLQQEISKILNNPTLCSPRNFSGDSVAKNLPANAGDARDLIPEVRKIPRVGNSNSSILAWKISWTEAPGGLPSMGLQRLAHGWTRTHRDTALHLKKLENEGQTKPKVSRR